MSRRIYTQEDANRINAIVTQRDQRLALYNKIGAGETATADPTKARADLRDQCYELARLHTDLCARLGNDVDDDTGHGYTALALDPAPPNWK